MTQSQRPSLPPLPPPLMPSLEEADLKRMDMEETTEDEAATQFLPASSQKLPPKSSGEAKNRPPIMPPAPPPLPKTPPRSFGRSPGQPSLAELVRQAFDEGFSDIHLGVGEKPRMRDRGEMTILEYPVLLQEY